jgi:DNA repair photolyase
MITRKTRINAPFKGRGATLNPDGRFESFTREADLEALSGEDENRAFPTTVHPEYARSIISRNDSPDISFSQSINPYAGCEHGCIYCYARPSHSYRGLSPGLDFESQLFAKVNAAEVLRKELTRPGYKCELIALGVNTDAYQPIERKLRITRSVIEVLAEFRHPVSLITKSALIERDLDLLGPMARQNLVAAHVSITNLDPKISRWLEPRASAPQRRLETIRALAEAGVPTGVMVAPVIPFLTDSYLEEILERAREAGATRAGYVMLRLPYEVKDLFKDWLDKHYPMKSAHVMSLVKQMREGRENDPCFGTRMSGTGVFADLIKRRFETALARLGFNADRRQLDTTRFRIPQRVEQLSLF